MIATMIEITGEFIEAVHHRLQWCVPGLTAPFVLVNPNGDPIDAMRRASELLPGEPTFFMVGWGFGERILQAELCGDDSCPFKSVRNHPLHPQGYLGDWAGAPVVASIYAEGIYAEGQNVVTTAENPGDVRYEPGNAVLIRVVDNNRS